MTKYVRLCVDMMGAIEMKIIKLRDGAYAISKNETEISYCPWCGTELVDWERLATSVTEVEDVLVEVAKQNFRAISSLTAGN